MPSLVATVCGSLIVAPRIVPWGQLVRVTPPRVRLETAASLIMPVPIPTLPLVEIVMAAVPSTATIMLPEPSKLIVFVPPSGRRKELVAVAGVGRRDMREDSASFTRPSQMLVPVSNNQRPYAVLVGPKYIRPSSYKNPSIRSIASFVNPMRLDLINKLPVIARVPAMSRSALVAEPITPSAAASASSVR